MGGNMARRLMRAGHLVSAFDLDPTRVKDVEGAGADGADSLEALVESLDRPRHVWIMLPAGEITERCVQRLGTLLDSGDVIIDGGNSYFKDDARRAASLRSNGIHYVDVGTSGGVWGLERGYCLMVGGNTSAVEGMQAIFESLAPGQGDVPPAAGRSKDSSAERGWLHCGPAGAGHFVKMVHNGIEYGLMQAYAEGFDIMRNANSTALPAELRYDIALDDVAELWRRGSVVGSWLLDLTAQALAEDPGLKRYTGHVADSGEGRWTVQAAIEEAVPADVLTAALYVRFRSRQDHTFAEKCLSAMREKFGGHVEKR